MTVKIKMALLEIQIQLYLINRKKQAYPDILSPNSTAQMPVQFYIFYEFDVYICQSKI